MLTDFESWEYARRIYPESASGPVYDDNYSKRAGIAQAFRDGAKAAINQRAAERAGNVRGLLRDCLADQ